MYQLDDKYSHNGDWQRSHFRPAIRLREPTCMQIKQKETVLGTAPFYLCKYVLNIWLLEKFLWNQSFI